MFFGVLVAPFGDVHLQAALPDEHYGMVHSATVTLEPDTIVAPVDFSWGEVAGPDLDSDSDSDEGLPVHIMRESRTADHTVSVTSDGQGTATTSVSLDPPLSFTMPGEYAVSGGLVASGTVQRWQKRYVHESG